jgi:hypothetical protein
MALLAMTILSTALAAATSVTAWRLARRETRRSDARVAVLAAGIHGPDGPVKVATSAAIESFPSEYSAAGGADRPAPPSVGRRKWLMLSAAVGVVAGLVMTAATRRAATAPRTGSTAVSATAGSTRPSPQTTPAAAAPLELIALSHERGKDTLIVRGAIRNPANGTARDVPAVVVLTFDEHGIFLGSSESDVSADTLTPGARVSFSVRVPVTTSAAARYKVSFRSAGRIVPHVDRREPDANGSPDGSPAPRQTTPVQS